MTKRENVIKGLEACSLAHTKDDCIGYGCPYLIYNDKVSDDCQEQMFDDILAVLKAQKPVLDIDTWKCGNCGHTLEHQQLLGDNVLLHEHYNCCPECGRPVKWSEKC